MRISLDQYRELDQIAERRKGLRNTRTTRNHIRDLIALQVMEWQDKGEAEMCEFEVKVVKGVVWCRKI